MATLNRHANVGIFRKSERKSLMLWDDNLTSRAADKQERTNSEVCVQTPNGGEELVHKTVSRGTVGRKLLGWKCFTCVRARQKCMPSIESSVCVRCLKMNKKCTPRPTRSNNRTSAFSKRAPSYGGGGELQNGGKMKSTPELILHELMTQLPSLKPDEALDLVWEVNKKFDYRLDASKISRMRFRRTHLEDPASKAWITILDFIYTASAATTLENEPEVALLASCKGVIVIAQLNPALGNHVFTLHTTKLDQLSQYMAGRQEWDSLSDCLKLLGPHGPLDLMQTLQMTHFTGSWRDPHPRTPICPDIPVKATIVADIRRICAWGVAAAWSQKVDYRFFSSCVQGCYYGSPYEQDKFSNSVKYNLNNLSCGVAPCTPSVQDTSAPSIQYSPQDLSFRIIPTLRVQNVEFDIGSKHLPSPPQALSDYQVNLLREIHEQLGKTNLELSNPKRRMNQLCKWLLSDRQDFEKLYLGEEMWKALHRIGWRPRFNVRFKRIPTSVDTMAT